MRTIATLYIENIARAAGHELDEDGTLIANGEVVMTMPFDGSKVPAEHYYAALMWILDHCEDRTALALEHARTLDIDRLGVLGLAWKAAPTLGDTLQQTERYFGVLSDALQYRLTVDGDTATFRQQSLLPPNPGLIMSREGGLGAAVNVMRTITETDVPLAALHFEHEGPPNAAAYEAFFKCPVIFEAPQNAIVMPKETLAIPNVLGDNALSRYLTAQLDEALREAGPSDPVARQLPKMISESLSKGVPTAAGLARELGMSERSFHRKLSDLGATYRSICEATQNEIARGLLADSSYSIAEVAFLTGFSEQSAFTRAFKRWVGDTPASYRKKTAGL